LLHLAVKYNRGGLSRPKWNTGRGMGRVEDCENNVVRWLLSNPNFVQLFASDAWGNNAFHAAIGASMPEIGHRRLHFCSENYGGFFGDKHVSHAALYTLLHDSSYSKYAINTPNSKGLSPIALAMECSTSRVRYPMCIFFPDGTRKHVIPASQTSNLIIRSLLRKF